MWSEVAPKALQRNEKTFFFFFLESLHQALQRSAKLRAQALTRRESMNKSNNAEAGTGGRGCQGCHLGLEPHCCTGQVR